MTYNRVEHLIGNTPMLELRNLKRLLGFKADIFAKLECFNLTGSAKDRVALVMINNAEKDGILQENSVIIEPTSGNTGIGLAAIGASRGYRVVIVMPDTMSKERIIMMRAFGAEVVLSDGTKGMNGAIERAKELKEEIVGGFIAGQFVNPANPEAHRLSTGPEIFDDMEGKIDCFVASVGTGGTITGVGEYLKAKDAHVQVIAVEPAASPVLSCGIENAGPHKIQGIGAGFVPEVLNVDVIDKISTISDADAYKYGRMMGSIEGVSVGISSGAALAAAVEFAKLDENAGKRIVVLMPDSGNRYLTTEGYFE